MEDHHTCRRLLKWRSDIITRITAHASNNHLTDNVNATTNRHSTKANDEDNGRLLETSLRRCNDHQETRHKAKEATTTSPIISSPTNTSLDKAKASHLAKDSRHRVYSRAIALYVAWLATGLLTVHSVANFRLCLHSRSNPPRLTTLSRETECCPTHHWL